MRKAILSVGAAVLVAATISACGSGGSSTTVGGSGCQPAHPGLKTVRTGSLTVATYNFPPFTKIDGTKLGGAEGDVLSALAAAECLNVVAQPLDTGSVVSAAQSGRVDVAAGNWYCTAKRAAEVSLLGPAYTDQIGLISPDGAKTFADGCGSSGVM